jgi:DNA-binding transcriptional MocR family regulator
MAYDACLILQIQAHYLTQRNAMCSALSSLLNPKDCFFELPDGGMFVFLRFRPGFINIPSDEVFKVLAANGVIVVPGNDFMVPGCSGEEDKAAGMTIRLSYAATLPGQIHKGVERLAKGLTEVSKMK